MRFYFRMPIDYREGQPLQTIRSYRYLAHSSVAPVKRVVPQVAIAAAVSLGRLARWTTKSQIIGCGQAGNQRARQGV